MYGTLLNVAAYTAAVDGNRRAAAEYIGEAAAAATRLGPAPITGPPLSGPPALPSTRSASRRFSATTGPPSSTPGNSVRPHPHRRTPGPLLGRCRSRLPPVGQTRTLLRALLAAERAAPAEVRYRPPVHRMTEDLLRADRRSLPGLRAFARRIGVPDA